MPRWARVRRDGTYTEMCKPCRKKSGLFNGMMAPLPRQHRIKKAAPVAQPPAPKGKKGKK